MARTNTYIKVLIDSLYDDGMSIIKEASKTNDTNRKNWTFNMQDAYGCGIYYRGKCVKRGYVNKNPKSKGIHHGWEKHGIPDNTGRGYLDDFLDNYRPKSDGLCLVCVNAVYYTNILEDGAQGRPKRELSTQYKIISQSNLAFEALKKKYKNSYVQRLRG